MWNSKQTNTGEQKYQIHMLIYDISCLRFAKRWRVRIEQTISNSLNGLAAFTMHSRATLHSLVTFDSNLAFEPFTIVELV